MLSSVLTTQSSETSAQPLFIMLSVKCNLVRPTDRPNAAQDTPSMLLGDQQIASDTSLEMLPMLLMWLL